jgi:hypothetical protein
MTNTISKSTGTVGHALAALAIIAGLYAGPAAATNYSAGTLTGTPYINNVSVVAGAFADTYEFFLADPSQEVSAAAGTLTLDWSAFRLLHIKDLTLTLHNDSNTQIAVSFGDPASFSTILEGGNYHARIAGVADGVGGGNYTFSIAAAPVPEPETYGMLLAGLGVLGLIGRRRRMQ